MNGWKSQIDLALPCWDGYRGIMQNLASSRFPDVGSLNTCLPVNASNENGLPVQFVAASELPGVDYERHIFEAGQIPTRENNWHDLFNALVWCRLPRLKARINGLHYQQLGHQGGTGRGELRDALTLLDESGVIVQGTNPEVLKSLARHDWHSVFQTFRGSWHGELLIQVCGHAILEKFLNPYKAVTAHALLLQTPQLLSPDELDDALAHSLVECRWLESTASLSPLPLTGIPGWWNLSPQDIDFYNDLAVFRPPSRGRAAAPVHTFRSTGKPGFSPSG